MWRPDKEIWDKLLDSIRFHHGNELEDKTGKLEYSHLMLVEAGADALLTALFKLAEESPTKTFTIDSRVIGVYEEKTLGNVLIAMADIPKRIKEK